MPNLGPGSGGHAMRPDLSDILLNTGRFDAEWYAAQFADVAASGLDPVAHYLGYGHLMGRGISAEAPRLSDLPELARALSATPTVSYCVPVMNRPGDIRGTLPVNIAELADLRDEVEILVMFFDDDTETHDWIRSEFAQAVTTGHLRLILSDKLTSWHFGKAKNAFQRHIRGRVYSSLDGDNFVTGEETAQLLEIARAHPKGFLFHHFSGNWGDGSCGRVSLPAELYRRVGYDPAMLPRQYDEVDLILSTLLRAPEIPLVRYALGNHGLSSTRSTAFMDEARIDNPVIEVPPVRRLPPLNPHGENYVAETPALAAMQEFNQAQCFFKNAVSRRQREKYLKMAFSARRRVIDEMDGTALLTTLFEPAPRARVAPGALCLFACASDEGEFLPAFERHYRGLGVTDFFIVDDGTQERVSDVLTGPGVHVFRPATGTFATAKGLWLGALMKAHLAPGQWALTVDADELVDPPEGMDDLHALVAALAADGATYAPGLLIDMLPDGTLPAAALADAALPLTARFPCHADVTTAPPAPYRRYHAIDWGFGPYARLSWRVDARHHAFGSFDSLRKIPLFRYRPGLHLDQGLHTLHFSDGTAPPDASIWGAGHILTVRHYTLAKVFSEGGRGKLNARALGRDGPRYHSRTAGNVARLLQLGPEAALERLLALPRRAYAEGHLRAIDGAAYAEKADAA